MTAFYILRVSAEHSISDKLPIEHDMVNQGLDAQHNPIVVNPYAVPCIHDSLTSDVYP